VTPSLLPLTLAVVHLPAIVQTNYGYDKCAAKLG
jgi:hypothetical protein